MSDPFIGQIQMVAFSFAPRGWAFCDGQLLPISSNSALFSLLGTTFGGDGRTTFGLPDLRNRDARHVGEGTGPGLSAIEVGQKGGSETLQTGKGKAGTAEISGDTKKTYSVQDPYLGINHVIALLGVYPSRN